MLIETIPIVRSTTTLIPFHEERMLRSAHQLGLSPLRWSKVWSAVQKHLSEAGIADSPQLFRCTIVYDNQVREVRTVPYSIRELSTLRLVDVPSDFDYHLKYADRSCFTPYGSQCCPHEEPLLVQGGLLTDTTYTNIVLEYPDGSYLTPEAPLLPGTRRAALIAEKKITPAPLTREDLQKCTRVHLINAMMGLSELTITDIKEKSSVDDEGILG